MGAIIMEADMPFEEYIHTPDETVSKSKAKKYIQKKNNACKHLVTIVERTILEQKGTKLITWDELKRELSQAKFRKLNNDFNDSFIFEADDRQKQHHNDQQKI